MKILHASTYERAGGASIAARHLHLGLLASGVDSHIAVLEKQDETPNVQLVGGKISRRIIRPIMLRFEEKVLHTIYNLPKHPAVTSYSFMPSLHYKQLNIIQKDILHLHWITGGFLSPYTLHCLHAPIVWSMCDSWPFTGGCHFQSTGCQRYKVRCGRCPELCSDTEYDISRLHWIMKRKAVMGIKPVMIAKSREYVELAASSAMLQGIRIEHIPNCIDANIFKPLPKAMARDALGLPKESVIVLFGAVYAVDDHRKGFDLLCEAITRLTTDKQRNFLSIVFGASHTKNILPFSTRFLGRLHDEAALALAYSAADIFVCPSRQDNLPNTVLEALACGTPVVAFSVGGIPDMIEHGVNGYLARPQDVEDLAAGIAFLLDDAELRQRMGAMSREKIIREYAIPVIARRYIALYEDVLNQREV
jgi:glycosyltransferase involved in cell wall biosynthesis